MKNTFFALTAIAALATLLQAARPYTMRAWFPDGTGLEIYTETAGSAEIDAQGSIGIGPGVGKQDLVNRVVVDRDYNILFAYNLEASRGVIPGTVVIRIEPLSAATEAVLLSRDTGLKSPKFSGAHLPTVAGIREFPAVRVGEVVTLDILYNPSTGDKVFDVLRPITDPPPSPGRMVVTSRPTREPISLKDISIRVNGKNIAAPASWMIGAAVRIDIPQHGAYVVAAYEPQGSPPGQSFAPIAHADKKTLSWSIDGDRIEITSGTNVLAQSGNGNLWVYHDRRYRSKDQPDAVRLQTADTIEWLLPKRLNE